MKIDRKTLNLVIPIVDGVRTVKAANGGPDTEEDNIVAYVHAAPISREVFELYFLPLSSAFTKIYARGLGAIAGPRVAALLLKQAAQELDMWDGPQGVEAGLMNEIKRLMNFLHAGDKGWELIPYDSAIKGQLIAKEDQSEVENAVAFFIVASAMHRHADIASVLNGAAKLWTAETTSLNCTEFGNSLQTLRRAETSTERVPLSSIPS